MAIYCFHPRFFSQISHDLSTANRIQEGHPKWDPWGPKKPGEILGILPTVGVVQDAGDVHEISLRSKLSQITSANGWFLPSKTITLRGRLLSPHPAFFGPELKSRMKHERITYEVERTISRFCLRYISTENRKKCRNKRFFTSSWENLCISKSKTPSTHGIFNAQRNHG